MEQHIPELNRDSFPYWFIVACVTNKNKGLVRNIPEWKDLSFDNLKIEFKINGVDLDFLDMTERMKIAFDEQVEIVSKELVLDKLDRIAEIFDDIKEKTIEKIIDDLMIV